MTWMMMQVAFEHTAYVVDDVCCVDDVDAEKCVNYVDDVGEKMRRCWWCREAGVENV